AVARVLLHWRQAFSAAPAAGPAGPALAAGLEVMARVLAPPVLAALAAVLGVGFLQTRGVLAWGALRPDLGRLSPRAGLARIAGGQAALEVGKGALTLVLVAAIVWTTLRPVLGGITALPGASPARLLRAGGGRPRRAADGRADQADRARGGRAGVPGRQLGALAARPAGGGRNPARPLRGGRRDPAGRVRDARPGRRGGPAPPIAGG